MQIEEGLELRRRAGRNVLQRPELVLRRRHGAVEARDLGVNRLLGDLVMRYLEARGRDEVGVAQGYPAGDRVAVSTKFILPRRICPRSAW